MLNFVNLLTVLFIGLKLTGHIAWAWLWVLSPLSVPIIILGAVWLKDKQHTKKVMAKWANLRTKK